MTMRIAVALSGRGSNFEALLRALGPGAPAEVVLALSDRSAPGLAFAESRNIPTEVLRHSDDGVEWLSPAPREIRDIESMMAREPSLPLP